MTESIKGSQEAEILSQLIDELNAGQQPESDNPETAELLAIAALIKNAEPVVRPPQHLLDQTVDKILAEQSAKPVKQPKKFWSWLNPGVLGAAASLLLVAGLQLYPSWNSSEVQTVSAPANVIEKQEPVPLAQPAATGAGKIPAAAMRQASPATEAQEKTSEALSERPQIPTALQPVNPSLSNNGNSGIPTANSAEPAAPETTKKAPVLNEQAPVKAEKAPIMMEKASVSNKSGSINKAAAFTMDDPADRLPLPILSLPGQTPDEISSDKKTGTVRQVFWKGTPQEVIITQRRVRLEETAAQAAPIIKPEPGEEKTAALNSVTLILHGQEVTVEGRRTEQELTKIAKQLTSP